MTSRSYDSAASESRSARHRVTDDEVFKDVGRDGSKSVKFPEKMIKVLEQKLQNIAMGKDPGYTDQLIRRTVAIFYGSYTTDPLRKQIKENRKIEELILMFAATSTSALKKDPQLANEGWKTELNNQIAQFVRILRECIRNVSHVSPELSARLDMYTAKLAPPSASDSGSISDGASGSRTGEPSISLAVKDMPLVRAVGELFGLTDQDIQAEVNSIKPFCTEKAALLDLKTCLKNLNAGLPFPGRREDFESDAAWHNWRTAELAQLSQQMMFMVKLNPELAKSIPSDAMPTLHARPESVYSKSSVDLSAIGRSSSIGSRQSLAFPDSLGDALEDDDEVEAGASFIYIPPNPRRFFKRFLELCMEADLAAMAHLPEDQEVNDSRLGILSVPHLELINECAVRWRIPHAHRVTAILDVIRYKYEREEVPLECIPEALQHVERVMRETELDKWARHDSDYLATTFGSIFNIFLGHLYHALDALPSLKPAEIAPFLDILDRVRGSGLLDRFQVDVNGRLGDLQEKARALCTQFYSEKKQELFSQPGVNRAYPLLLLTDDLEKYAKLLDKRYPDPILGHLDLVAIWLETCIPLFIDDLAACRKALVEGSANLPTPDVPIEDIFTLFRRTKTLTEMFEDVCPQYDLQFSLTAYFELFVRQWLMVTDNRTLQWVQNAVAADKFEPEEGSTTSSSIVDLFDSLRSPISFLLDLKWPDGYQNARFFTGLSKSISKAVEHYCRSIEELFMAEMFPRPTDHLQPQKQSAWLEKAKQTIQIGEKKIEPFSFQPASCVKLNNIEAARKLLDKMYDQMDADRISSDLADLAPPVPEKEERQRFLFTVKVANAEGLVPLDSNPSAKLDTFVTLSDENGNRIAKTRTIYEQLDPRWDETFDISVEKPLWLMISIRDRALIGKHDTVGRAYICLDPRRFGDLLSHDLWFDLDTQGRILLRVGMEGEKDDIQFHFGRAFRSLKRCEGDMVRIFTDKMLPFFQQSLSRHVLRLLTKGTGIGLDYNKAIGGVQALYRQALGANTSEVLIPLPASEKPRVREGELTDLEMEQAITPLFDFLDANLQILNTYLSDVTKEMVMSRAWKELLNVIEGLLIPPLSDAPSDMKPLSDKEVDIVFKWLKFLRDYFYAGGEGPVPLETLQNQKYRDVISIRLYYDWTTDALMEECVRMMQHSLKSSTSLRKKAKTVYSQRNLGTIKDRKREKREAKDTNSGDVIMRILRMRSGTSDFLSHQLQIIATIQSQAEQRGQVLQGQGARRVQQNQPQTPDRSSQIPAVPPLPPLRSPGLT
ncbi:hypothetical protein SISSUDRAFT_987298 [Sistotremastrum suecicum HHB10207 ss-3]|uniref:Uncharacterized protein n=1 Tax=Sistotremastrum suecicum HHB10207 ss-3 TaxID=1314776 RepID=A0A166CPK4_9AGAM|nr:hypothetical protein SISSUDRAFT_987298 [Sistotremastrum suecicum HHB10207 ss-3]